MEVVSHLWLEDGRLLILAVGLCRIKVCYQNGYWRFQNHGLASILSALLTVHTSLYGSLPC